MICYNDLLKSFLELLFLIVVAFLIPVLFTFVVVVLGLNSGLWSLLLGFVFTLYWLFALFVLYTILVVTISEGVRMGLKK